MGISGIYIYILELFRSKLEYYFTLYEKYKQYFKFSFGRLIFIYLIGYREFFFNLDISKSINKGNI
jgi:hypothetical protein